MFDMKLVFLQRAGFSVLIISLFGFLSLTTLAMAGEKKLNLTTDYGKVGLLDFRASWCGPCQLSFPFMEELIHNYSENNNILSTKLTFDNLNGATPNDKEPWKSRQIFISSIRHAINDENENKSRTGISGRTIIINPAARQRSLQLNYSFGSITDHPMGPNKIFSIIFPANMIPPLIAKIDSRQDSFNPTTVSLSDDYMWNDQIEFYNIVNGYPQSKAGPRETLPGGNQDLTFYGGTNAGSIMNGIKVKF